MTLAEAAWQHYAEHQTRSWSCPLCPFSTTAPMLPRLRSVMRHAAEQHPAYLPEKQTVADMLDTLPALLVEAALTVDAPNPSGPRLQYEGGSVDVRDWANTRKGARSKRGTTREERVPASESDAKPRGERWSPTPRAIRLMMRFNPDRDDSLFGSLLLCSRLIWEAVDEPTKLAHPYPAPPASWWPEIRWMRAIWPDAQAFLDRADFDWITAEVRWLSQTLAALAGVRRRPRNLCPDCKAPMHLDESDWLTCDAGHQHPGPKRLEREWRRKPPMPTKDICEALRIGERTLLRYHSDKRIAPTRTEGRKMFWLPWDVIRCRYPDIVAEIDTRDAA